MADFEATIQTDRAFFVHKYLSEITSFSEDMPATDFEGESELDEVQVRGALLVSSFEFECTCLLLLKRRLCPSTVRKGSSLTACTFFS